MREKLTVIKVGGKIVEEEATLCKLLMILPLSRATKCWYMAADVRQRKSQPGWALKAKW